MMVGDLNDKQVHWNSHMSTRPGKLLRDYTDNNSFLIFRPETEAPTHTTPPVQPMPWT